MKKILSIALSVIMVVTMFAGASVQFVAAEDTTTETVETTNAGYRYESIFDFSQDIPATTTLNENKLYAVERVQDAENENKWAMKITQASSTYDGDYLKFKLSDPIAIPTGEGLAFNEKIIGMRISYRTNNAIDGNIGFIIPWDWDYRLLERDEVYEDAGIYDKTALFDGTNVELGSSYALTFEPRAKSGKPLEIYIYDIQFVYEVTEYRYSTVYDFENMTDEQAQSLFEKYNSNWADADITIEQDAVKNDKYLKIMANTAYSDYGRNATSWQTTDFNIPNDEHCVGIRIHYEGINLRAGRIAFLQSYNWTDINMLTESSTDIGERDAVAFFKDDTKLTISSSSSVALVLQLKTAETSDTTLLPGIKIYKIEFLYDDVFDGVVKTLRDYEDKEEGVTVTCSESVITMDTDEDIDCPTRPGTSSFGYFSGVGQNASMGLKRVASGVSYQNAQILNIDKSIMGDENLIGMRIWVKLKKESSPRIQVRLNGNWSTLQFNASDNNLSAGAHDIVVMFDKDLIENGMDGTTYSFIDQRGNYDSQLRLDDGDNEIVFDNIELIYKEGTASGEEDTPKYRYSTVYDFENMTDAQAQELFVDEKNGSWATATVTVPEVQDGQDKYVQIMADKAYSDYGRNAIRYKLSGFNIPNDEHCVGIRIQYEGINLRAGKIAFIQSYNWTDTNMLPESSVDIGYRDVAAFFSDDTTLTISSSSSVDLVFYLRTAETSDTTLLPGIKIYNIEFLYDDVFDGSTVTVRDYEDETEGVIYENYQGTPTDDSEDITHNGGTSGTTEFAYISGAGQNASMGLKRTTDSSVSWHNDSFLKISKETMADPALIGMRLWVSLKNRGKPRIQVRYDGTWTTLQFNASNNELNAGAHDIVVMFKDGLIEVGTDSATTDFSTARYSASTDFYLALDVGGENEIVFDNIEFIYANPTTAEFIDATGISGTNSVHTTEGNVGSEIEFPANLAPVNEYEYFFAGWAQESGKDNMVSSSATHTDADVKYYAVWTPGVSELRKVVLSNTNSAWVENNVNADDVVDIRDLVYQNECTEELKFQAALAEMNMSGTSFLESFGTQETATMNGFAATANTEVATSKVLGVGDYIQLNFEDYTSINTFTVNETTTNVRDFRIMAWNGEEWVRVYRNDLIEGTHECVLEQDVCTLALRLYIDELKDGTTTATIASVTANGRGKIERTEKFGLTAFIGDSVYKHNWETIDSDILEAYDDVILINNWHFDEVGNLAVSVSTDEGTTRTLYSSTSDEGKTWTKTFLDNYDGLFDASVKDEDKPKIWLSLTALKKEGNWDSSLDSFSPMNQAWYEGTTGTYQPGESDAYGEQTVRTALINNITEYINYIETTLGYEIYGIDIDWEYPYGDEQQEDYYNLLKELGTALHTNGKKLSIDQLVDWCTLPYSYYNNSAIDRINIMTYSHNETGTDYQHSTYLDACVNAIKGYADAGVDLSKIYLGVPFYGVEMVNENAASTDWNKISVGAFDRGVNNYTINGVEYNFNGPNVLQDKVLYSLQQELGGMMVWWIKNDYTVREATEAGVEYNKDLTLTYYLRDTVERFSYVDEQE